MSEVTILLSGNTNFSYVSDKSVTQLRNELEEAMRNDEKIISVRDDINKHTIIVNKEKILTIDISEKKDD